MSVESFASFLRNIGHKVRRVGDLYWFNVYPHVYLSFPYHKLVDPLLTPMDKVMRADGFMARFPCDMRLGRPSYRQVCSGDYGLSHLAGKARNQTRRGLERCRVNQISFDELTDIGRTLNKETFIRQGRKISSKSNQYWEKYCYFASQCQGAEAWGAFVNNNLGAYLIAFQMENCTNISILRSSTRFLSYYPNNALLFTYNQETLKRFDVNEISIGWQPIQLEIESLNRFKRNMGFIELPFGMRIEIAPWIRLWLRGPMLRLLSIFAEKRSQDERLSKFVGMLKWYSEQPCLI